MDSLRPSMKAPEERRLSAKDIRPARKTKIENGNKEFNKLNALTKVELFVNFRFET